MWFCRFRILNWEAGKVRWVLKSRQEALMAATHWPSKLSFVRRSILRRPTVRASEYMKDFDIWQIHQTNKQKYFLDISRRVLDVFKNYAMTAQFIFIFEISYVIIRVVIYSIWQISVFLFKKINNYFVDNPNVLIHDPLLIWKNFNEEIIFFWHSICFQL